MTYHGVAENKIYPPWVAGKHLESCGSFDSYNPATGEPWAVVARTSPLQLDHAVISARDAFDSGVWSQLPAAERAAQLRMVAAAVSENCEYLAGVETTDNGKLLRTSKAEVESIPAFIGYYASLLESQRTEELEISARIRGATHSGPIGVVAAITPSNSPLMLGCWKIVPALAAGNHVVVKPSPDASVSTIELARILSSAGLPAGVLNVVTGGAEVALELARHPGVDVVAVTGSTAAVRSLGTVAAEQLKVFKYEGGGKSPLIVFADADLDLAIEAAVRGSFGSSGQSCVASSRILIERELLDDFAAWLSVRARNLRVGQPTRMDVEVGPMTSGARRNSVERQVAEAVSRGAIVLTGGSRPADPDLRSGYYLEPTVVKGISNNDLLAQTELFAPVTVLIPFEDETDAICQANSVEYGLAAGVFTEDAARADRVGRALEVGTVWKNCYRAFDHRLPFGGFKHSGNTKECGPEAIHEFLRVKTIFTYA